MHRALRQQGFAVEFAGDYAQVVALLRDREFDVVLLEVTGEHAGRSRQLQLRSP